MFAMFLKWFNKLRALLLPYNKYISAMDIDGLEFNDSRMTWTNQKSERN